MAAGPAQAVLCPRCGLGVDAPDRFCRTCGAPLQAAPAGHELRKTVTVVFCDVSGSTPLGERLDPEALRHVLGRYYADMRAVLERHGGLVEKFIGDAVVAVFGVPVVHEDDALRAVRAAVEMRVALERLNDELELESGVRIAVRIGVNTGEVIAGDLGPGASFASGDAVNVAARLEQAARPDEILLGALTREFLADAVAAEPVEPLELRGKSERVTAFRLAEVRPDAEPIGRRSDGSFVGRQVELASVRAAFEEAVAEPGCRLVTVVGEPGIGKTRLLAEFTRSLGGAARVLIGHCLPYGEGITYRPLAEIVRQLGGLDDCLASDERGDTVRDLMLGATGGASGRPGLTDEIQWAARRLLEALANERPLVLCLEDLHWAEPTFLQLVEYVAGCSTGSPILLLAAARAELLESHPGWALPQRNRRLLPLEPLPDEDADALIAALAAGRPVSEGLRRRVARAGGGNPLFLEQLLAHRREGDDETLPLPPTIRTLLAARLDRLTTAERDVLERAAVEGVTFSRGSLTELLPAESRTEIGPSLLAAVRHDLIRPRVTESGESFGFVHALVRDAVYESMPKELRAEIHERCAELLERDPGNEEGVAYHLEQSCRQRAALGPPDPRTRSIAARAARLLAASGESAQLRGDMPAATNLLRRTVDILPPDDPLRLAVVPELASALVEAGKPASAQTLLEEAIETARSAGNHRVEARARAEMLRVRSWTDPYFDLAAAVDEAEQLVAPARGDDRTEAAVFGALGNVLLALSRNADAKRAFTRGREHARRAGNRYLEARMMCWTLAVEASGPTPVPQALAFGRTLLDRSDEMPRAGLYARVWTAVLLSFQGRFDEARRLFAESAARADALGHAWVRAWQPGHEADCELLAGDPAAAETKLQEALEAVETLGEAQRSGVMIQLAAALYAQGRFDRAEACLASVPPPSARFDPVERAARLSIEACLHARHDRFDEAERLSAQALEAVAETDNLVERGRVLLGVAEVCVLTGRPEAAAEWTRAALDLFERKEAAAWAQRARAVLEALPQPVGTN